MVRIRSFTLALCAGLVVAGCGGDGSSINNGVIASQNANNNVPKASSEGDLGLFLTGNADKQLDHVWVSVKKVDLKLAAGGLRTVFEDERGVGIDLARLSDETGPQYRFINALVLPAGTYVGAQVTFAKEAVAFPAKSTSGKPIAFGGQAKGAEDAVVDVQFDPPKMLGTGHNDLVLDFKLEQANDELIAKVSSSLGAGLEDADRNAPFVAEGVIENVKGDVPSQTFALKNGNSVGIPVSTAATTALVANQGSAPFVLSKGANVEVYGAFDTNTRRFDASSIRLIDPKAKAAAQMTGAVASIDVKTGTWTVSPSMTRGLLPDALTITIGLASDAKFFNASGLPIDKDAWFNALSEESANVLVHGTYDSAKSVFTATEARLQDSVSPQSVRVSGVVTNPSSAEQLFGLTVATYQGLMTKPGANAVIGVTATTSLTDADGKTLTSEQFFAALSSAKNAEVEGTLDTSTGRVLATTIKLSTAPAPKEKKPAKKD